MKDQQPLKHLLLKNKTMTTMLTDIFKQFFLLGWISFGGPAAHIGYFHQKFVQQLGWISQEKYGQIVALSQFLPGPGSSQVGFALGYQKAGIIGAFTAFIAFTAPSVILMLALAQLSQQFISSSFSYGIIHGLKLLAVVVVADAVFTMFTSFCKNTLTRTIALFATITLLLSSNVLTQMSVLVIAALVGMRYLSLQVSRNETLDVQANTPMFSWWPLLLFIGLFALFIALSSHSVEWQIISDFYHAGSLVFGGGHVVLPILQNLLTDQLTTDTFLTGYAAAQAVPGPMFTLATYLGFHLSPQAPYVGALLATFSIFIPGFLLMLTFLKHWQNLANLPKITGALQGVNAAVVGLLFSALCFPILGSAILNIQDIAIVIIGFYLLKQMRTPILWLVLGFSLVGVFFNNLS